MPLFSALVHSSEEFKVIDRSHPCWQRGYRPREAFQLISCGKSKGYQLIAAGRLDARKLDGMTIITGESIARLLESLSTEPVSQKVSAPALASDRA